MKKREHMIKLCLVGLLTSATIAQEATAEEKLKELAPTIAIGQAPVDAKTISGTADVIQGDRIRTAGIATVADAFRYMPGVTLNRGPGGRQEPLIRGLNAEYGLVLIDGQRIPNTDRNIPFTSNRFDLVSVDEIERIEVIRGASSNLYGADAMAGVINIITKEPQEGFGGASSYRVEKVDGAADASHLFNLAAYGKLTDKLSLRVGFERKLESPIEVNGNQVTSDRNISKYSLRARYKFSETGKLDFNALRLEEKGSANIASFRSPTGTALDLTDQEFNQFSLKFSDVYGGFNFSAAANYSTNKSGVRKGDIWNNDEAGITLLADGALNDKHYLSMGALYRSEKVDRASRDFASKESSVNLHLQDRYQLTDKFSVTAGTAADFHSRYGTELSPKIGVNYAFNNNLELKASYSSSYSAPALREASSDYRIPAGPTRTYVGNDDLQPETVKALEAGIYYRDKKQKASLTVFRNKVDDLITTVNKPNPGGPSGSTISEYNNVEKAEILGVEAQWSYDFSEKSNLVLGYTFLGTEDNQGRDLTRRPAHQITAEYLQKTEWLGGLDFYSTIKFVGKQVNSHAQNLGPGFSTPYEEIESHFTANFGISKQITDSFKLQMGVDNIFNDSVYENSGDVYQQGRTAWLKLSTEF